MASVAGRICAPARQGMTALLAKAPLRVSEDSEQQPLQHGFDFAVGGWVTQSVRGKCTGWQIEPASEKPENLTPDFCNSPGIDICHFPATGFIMEDRNCFSCAVVLNEREILNGRRHPHRKFAQGLHVGATAGRCRRLS